MELQWNLVTDIEGGSSGNIFTMLIGRSTIKTSPGIIRGSRRDTIGTEPQEYI